jgi:hypothetical protein
MTMDVPAAETRSRSPTSTERVRRHRKRHRNGMRIVPVQLHESEIDSLVRQRYLKRERRHLPEAVEDALNGFVTDKLGTPLEEG